MEIIIDYREKQLYEICLNLTHTTPKFENIKLTTSNLDIGDFLINFNGKKHLIIERKSTNDLLASIKDGRYKEQHYRLKNSGYHPHNIIYLIEQSKMSPSYYEKHKQIIYSSIFSMNYYKGFTVFTTNSLVDTAYTLCNMALKISIEESKGNEPFYYKVIQPLISLEENKETTPLISPSERLDTVDVDNVDDERDDQDKRDNDNMEKVEVSENYCSLVKKKKSDNITADNIGEIFLCQIPSVSSVTAIAVMKEFHTFGELVLAVKTEEGKEKLKNIKCGEKLRKISKTSVEKNNTIFEMKIKLIFFYYFYGLNKMDTPLINSERERDSEKINTFTLFMGIAYIIDLIIFIVGAYYYANSYDKNNVSIYPTWTKVCMALGTPSLIITVILIIYVFLDSQKNNPLYNPVGHIVAP
jgi:ERCC4-type nuclease